MKTFLNLISDDLYARFGTALSEITVILPSRRPEYFFYRYLSQAAKQDILAPKVITLDELITDWSQLTIAGNLELIYHLYNVYKEVTHSDETFDQFFFWGELMLSDFGDIDKNLADPKKIFAHIKELKSIEEMFVDEDMNKLISNFWKSIYSEENSTIKERFLKFWENLLPVYTHYVAHLKKSNLAYKGMAYRNVCESIQNKTAKIPNCQYIVAGFDALSNSEIEILKHLQANNQVLFYWDYDESYLKEPYEAGRFMRENLQMFPSALSSSNFKNYSQKKNVIRAEVPGLSGIANIATEHAIAMDADTNLDPDNTALILVDQNLLFPTISALPKIENLNITLGWPVKHAEPASFLLHLLDVWQSMEHREAQNTIAVSVIRKLISHSWIAPELADKIIELCEGNLFVKTDVLKIDPLLNIILGRKEKDLTKTCINTLKHQQKQFHESPLKDATLESEVIYHLLNQFNQLSNVFAKFDIKLTVLTQIRLLKQIISNMSIPFEGSPLSGLQITNLTETRCLDFKNIIFAGINEGILPNNSVKISHIPHSIRKAFKLPTFENMVNQEAYYFYRSLQRAQNIVFISNTDEQEVEKIEESRFVKQIFLEQSWNFAKTQNYNYNLKIEYPSPISYGWSEKVEKYMSRYSVSEKHGISPSAINTYLDCPLKFYLKYPMQLKEPNITSETMDPRIFGNLVHLTLEQLYTPFLNKTVEAEKFKVLLGSNIVENAVEEVYQKSKDINADSGYNNLFKSIVIEYAKQIIAMDAENAPIKILGLEVPISGDITIKTSDGEKNIYIKGNIDRVDEHNGVIRILDYKTGNPEISVKANLENVFTDDKTRRKEALQAFTYAWLYSMQASNEKTVPIQSGLIITRKAFKKEYPMFHISGMKDIPINFNDIEDLFIEKISELLSKIFDNKNKFEQTKSIESCKYCPYKQICQR
ncbi:MAG: PD-(D/E)XK nuclease family protein [Salinivirgaceae bacterium]|nr:PD-(D/E)XK nuclease family protein [Salinivirgaceae bacterium]